jgi:hypothetical protein
MDTRLARLRELIEQHGGPLALSKKLGYTNASYLVQMTGPNPMRPVSERTARRYERQLGLPEGWLDQAPTEPVVAPESPDTIAGIVRLVGQVLDAEKVSVPISRFADIVALASEHSASGREEFVHQLAKLVKP